MWSSPMLTPSTGNIKYGFGLIIGEYLNEKMQSYVKFQSLCNCSKMQFSGFWVEKIFSFCIMDFKSFQTWVEFKWNEIAFDKK